jgi:N-acyl homoserine lactone hydrolase
MQIQLIFEGFPGKINRGALGWSSVTLIRSGKRNLLLDTGSFGDQVELIKRLAQVGLAPTDIDTILLSHFHFDHVINAHLFPKATYLLSREEAEYVTGGSGDWAVPEYYFPHLEKTGRLQLIETDTMIAEGVRTLLTPGHTPGLMSLLLEQEAMPPTIIASDAVKNLVELQTGRVPMAWNANVSQRTIENIKDRVTRVIPGHDRILHVEGDRIYACQSVKERIQLPEGLLDVASFDLHVPETTNEPCPCCKHVVDYRQLEIK